jgi:uncharacterized membrane protein YbhN (UPF0104 family)
MANKNNKFNWRAVAGVIVAAAALVFIYTQRDAINSSLIALKDADTRFILLAVVTFATSVMAAAGVVYNLKFKPKLKYPVVLSVQTAGLFLGRINTGIDRCYWRYDKTFGNARA